MKIEERLKRITTREVLTKTRTLSLVLSIINVVVLFVFAYIYILFDIIIGPEKILAIVLVTFALFGLYAILGEEGY
jgi:ABC-type protease/lipase transport system fused ATPase/permease subunit